MGASGMDIAQIRSLSSEIRARATDVLGVVDRLTAAFEGVEWIGQDRDIFLREWRDRHAQALRGVASSMQAAAVDSANSATAQERASAAT